MRTCASGRPNYLIELVLRVPRLRRRNPGARLAAAAENPAGPHTRAGGRFRGRHASAQVLAELEKSKVYLCLEPLAPAEADFLQTAAEGLKLRDRLGHPRVQLHLDTKAMSSGERTGSSRHPPVSRMDEHFHANDANRRGPGFGDTDFVPIFQALKDVKYPGWVSVEVFDYSPDPETIARESIRYMRECEKRIASVTRRTHMRGPRTMNREPNDSATQPPARRHIHRRGAERSDGRHSPAKTPPSGLPSP